MATSLRELDAGSPGTLPLAMLQDAGEPVVLRGVASHWGLVDAGRQGASAAMAYLRERDSGRPVQYSQGEAGNGGRPFYRDDFTRLNFDVRRGGLAAVLDGLAAGLGDPRAPMVYIASLPVDGALRDFREGNALDFAAHGIDPPPSIWIGNRVTASCHYDAPSNIACVAVGRRRFTLLPPEQIGNLYPGPLEPTPGGQVVSTVDFAAPDLDRHPRFRDAWDAARSAVLEPGDAIFIPSMWWHQVEGLDDFNVLVNYWWSSVPAHVPTPMHALYHALWTLRDRPQREKDAWRHVFDYYVFGPVEQARDHLPEAARGPLAPIDDTMARQLRAMLLGKLNR
ncbi:MAG TPA: cupin-like domain-containing protein [Thermomonas sp.]|nr:cupin-like domain-containing protein [Thermomonas sp.]